MDDFIPAPGYTSLEVEEELRDEDRLADIRQASTGGPDFTGSGVEESDDYVRLPRAPKVPTGHRLESFDREVVVCEHELARALEAFLTNQPVRLYDADIEFQAVAQQVLDLVHEQKCGLKGR